MSLQSALVELPIANVVVGTGARFIEIYEILLSAGAFSDDVPMSYSPFCGSADGLEKNGSVIITGYIEVPQGKYLNLRNQAFDPWAFVLCLPDNTLLCAGGELLIALGRKDINKKGCLYQIAGTDITLLAEGKAE